MPILSMISKAYFSSDDDFWTFNKLLIKNFNPKNGFLIIDDVIVEKTGNCIEEVDIYFDHAKNRYVLGHQLITTYFVTKWKKFQFPVDFRLYLKKENTKEFKTKIELAKQLIEQAIEECIPFSTVIIDCLYCSNKLVKFLNSKNINWVSVCRSNRLIVTSNGKIQLKEYEKSIPKEKFVKINFGEKWTRS